MKVIFDFIFFDPVTSFIILFGITMIGEELFVRLKKRLTKP